MTSLSYPSPEKPWSRELVLTLVNSALTTREKRYARQIAVAWLTAFPGDLQFQLFHAKALRLSDQASPREQALTILEKLCLTDPEYVEAQKVLLQARLEQGLDVSINSACVLALGGTAAHHLQANHSIPSWALRLQKVRRGWSHTSPTSHQNADNAEHMIHRALLERSDTPLVAVTHLRHMATNSAYPIMAISSMAEVYLSQWPNCLPLELILAHALMDGGNFERGVDILHRAATQDVTGQVPKRLWGINHPYSNLWPSNLEITPTNLDSPQSYPIPAAVSAIFGWNQLPETANGLYSQPFINASTEAENTVTFPSQIPAHAPFSHQEIGRKKFGVSSSSHKPPPYQKDLNQAASHLKQPYLSQRDGLFPVYVILSTRMGLEKLYGAQNIPLIEDTLKRLARSIRGKRIGHENWGAILFFADDPAHATAFGIRPACHNDPWSLKLTLVDLDMALGKRGEKIGALLIIGGPEVVPFHHLPNPVDDTDSEVPSDNPYATRDDNYFVAEWPVGRVPAGNNPDPGPLLQVLRTMIDYHNSKDHRQPWYLRYWQLFVELFRPCQTRKRSSFGYTAAVWRRAALSVFRSIGEPRSLAVSPPVQACDLNSNRQTPDPPIETPTTPHQCLAFPPSRLGYFNLHGLPDASEWYGQRDPTEPGEGPDFPIALRPQDIRNGGSAPQVIFSEACYGAHILGKGVEDAISLKFLVSGSQAVVGSTCICYGSITTPLIAADLLGRVFWNLLSDGLAVGEALRRAKLYLAREMHHRQGFLDAEDQKTLISFVLYGDPLAQAYSSAHNPNQNEITTQPPSQINTKCDRHTGTGNEIPIPPEITTQVREIVSHYLPGMVGAKISLTSEHNGDKKVCSSCNSCSICPAAQQQKNPKQASSSERRVIVLSKKVEQADLIHQQYARLTIDQSGKLVKLAISR
jgi:hypothetical protein